MALLGFFCVLFFNLYKELPEGINFVGQEIFLSDTEIDFLYDLTYIDSNNEKVYKQEIFDTIYKTIEEANEYILIDMFLFNSWLGKSDSAYINLSSNLVDSLVDRKKENPEIKIDFISDPINTVYGGSVNYDIERLKESGINVIITNLVPLRDSNPLYSSFWRIFLQWFGNSEGPKWIAHPFSEKEEKVSLRSYLTLVNFKANHRKVLLADNNGSYVSIISSANPHSSSSEHSNVAIKITSKDFANNIWLSEEAVAKMSDGSLSNPFSNGDEINSSSEHLVQLITEKKIKDSLIYNFNNTKKGDKIKIAMFYLSEREIIKSLIRASERDVEVFIVLDPNKDAFGYKKSGIPNRQVASELTKKSDGKVKIRWYKTNGEQFHSKIVFIEKQDSESIIILGSANLTRRNINNYNLESNVLVKSQSDTDFVDEVENYFRLIWDNERGNLYTVDYSEYSDDSILKKIIYRFQEFSGLSSF